jgi:hypothetical protein
MFAELGQHVEAMASYVDDAAAATAATAATGVHAAEDIGAGAGAGARVVEDFILTVPLSYRVKKTVAAVAAAKGLPPTHRLRLALEGPGGGVLGGFAKKRTLPGAAKGGGRGEVDDDLWAAAAALGASRGGRGPARRVDDDSDIWATAPARSLPPAFSTAASSSSGSSGSGTGGEVTTLAAAVDKYLLQLLSDALQVDEAVMRRPEVKAIADYRKDGAPPGLSLTLPVPRLPSLSPSVGLGDVCRCVLGRPLEDRDHRKVCSKGCAVCNRLAL